MAWIYLIKNKVNDKKYVGFTTIDPVARFNQHRTQSGSRLMHSAIKKYGADSFEVIPLYWGFDDGHTLLVMEEHFVREYCSHYIDGHGYNMSYGGTSNRKGKKATSEQRAQMSKSRTGQRRPSSGSAISAALKGRTISSQWRQKLAAANLGKTLSLETRAAMSGPRGKQKNSSSIICTCVSCKRELDIRGLNNHRRVCVDIY